MPAVTMPRLLAPALAATLAALLLAAPAALGQGKPEDVQRVERAVLELDRAKRSLTGEVTARRAVLARSLRRCKSSGKGWKRIKRVRNGSQRRTYRRGARTLWSELNRVAVERAALDVYRPILERFLGHFQRPLADPLIQAGVDAHRRRLAYNAEATSFATCKTFNKLTKSVRGYRADAEGDIKAGHVNLRLTAYVADRERIALRKHWGSRYERALLAARDRIKSLGGNGGYADYFAFAHSLRV